jgi:hypothetical protein
MLLRLPQMEYNISIPMLISLGILIFTGINFRCYSVGITYDGKWHHIHIKFLDNQFRHLGNVMVITTTL